MPVNNMEVFNTYYRSEIGPIEIVGTEEGIISVSFIEHPGSPIIDVPECIRQCVSQLDQYFLGKRLEFDLRLLMHGTDFQKKVWEALFTIPYGQTRSYGEIAKMTGRNKAFRAVGNANNKNKIAIIIPCHRVIGSNGKLIGYAAGLWRKQWLLEHEKRVMLKKGISS
ncbi:Methylated-DNA--protein-cysteine methyltransferase [uncultured Desulfobacterium sp.]|uniref:Methylated-DNA--protein-cysteine methyltransferase n=1 Tax=uncultured Desulfobacterium sp. TaxID=201089 RepID=A0A445N256_9BACT|nr:Methylated-DNA--protein-cysteine methyltransferase [uncultured Desulfobacterium sp.]